MQSNRHPSAEDSSGKMQPLQFFHEYSSAQSKQASIADTHSQISFSPIATDRSSLNPAHFEASSYFPNRNLQRQPPGPNAHGRLWIQYTPEGETVDPTANLPCELRRGILESVLSNEESRVTSIPASMVSSSTDSKEPLIYNSTHSLLRTCKTFRSEYQDVLRRQTLDANTRRVSFHVLNFDFSAIIDSFFAKIEAKAREDMQSHSFRLILTFDTNFVTRSSTWNGYSDQRDADDSAEYSRASAKAERDMEDWLEFTVYERAAGRIMGQISYECVKLGDTEDERGELEDAIFALDQGLDPGPSLRSMLRACSDFSERRLAERR